MKDLTRLRYEDPRFVEAFRRRRGDRPRPYERRLLRRLLAVARSRLGARQPLLVLDVGTGYGRDLAWLQSQPGVRACGVDYSLAMLNAAGKNLRIADGTLAQMDVRQLGIRSACVDVVRAQALFHHLSRRDADEAMRELARVLRAGGLLRVFVRSGAWEGLLDEPGLGPRYFRYFTLKSLRALLRRHGLCLLEQERLMAHPNLPCLAVLAEKPRRV